MNNFLTQLFAFVAAVPADVLAWGQQQRRRIRESLVIYMAGILIGATLYLGGFAIGVWFSSGFGLLVQSVGCLLAAGIVLLAIIRIGEAIVVGGAGAATQDNGSAYAHGVKRFIGRTEVWILIVMTTTLILGYYFPEAFYGHPVRSLIGMALGIIVGVFEAADAEGPAFKKVKRGAAWALGIFLFVVVTEKITGVSWGQIGNGLIKLGEFGASGPWQALLVMLIFIQVLEAAYSLLIREKPQWPFILHKIGVLMKEGFGVQSRSGKVVSAALLLLIGAGGLWIAAPYIGINGGLSNLPSFRQMYYGTLNYFWAPEGLKQQPQPAPQQPQQPAPQPVQQPQPSILSQIGTSNMPITGGAKSTLKPGFGRNGWFSLQKGVSYSFGEDMQISVDRQVTETLPKGVTVTPTVSCYVQVKGHNVDVVFK